MFTQTENEIISSAWALSEYHSSSWLLMVANILKNGDKRSLADIAVKESQKESRSYVLSPQGKAISRNQETPDGSIGVVMLTGPMVKYGDWHYYGADELVSFAQDFESDPAIIGQIWIIDSGGGAVSAIAPYMEFLKHKTKPVIGLADICGSAAYYVGSALDKLYARNSISSMFGSIGTMATIVDYKGYLKNLGIEEHVIYSTLSNYKNASYHKALEGKYEDFQKEHLDPLAQNFQDHVLSKRINLNQSAEGILNGGMFYANSALSNGMIDGIMDFSEVVGQIKSLASARSFMNTNF